MFDYLMRETRKMADAQASQLEVAVCASCEDCGRRLLEDDKPIAGAVIASVEFQDGQHPLCGECFATRVKALREARP